MQKIHNESLFNLSFAVLLKYDFKGWLERLPVMLDGLYQEGCSVDSLTRGLLSPIVLAVEAERDECRKEKKFDEADKLKGELHKLGYDVQDYRGHTELHPVSKWVCAGDLK